VDLLILLEGDVSDVNLYMSDDDLDLVSNENEQVSPLTSPVTPKLDLVMIKVEVWEEEDLDDIPLSLHLQMSLSGDAEVQVVLVTSHCGSRCNLHWRMKGIEEVVAVCNTSFSDPPDEEITPFEYLKQMSRDEVIENFVEQSNLYCVQKTGRPLNTNKNEMEQFLDIHIMAGIVNMPSYRMYWPELTRFDPIADVMSRNRFDTMRNYFHISDNSTMKAHNDPEYDRLFKVRTLVDSIKPSFLEIEVEEYGSVDGLIIPFKGQSSLKQYVRNKPHKWRMKVVPRAGYSGILYDFEVYMGKGNVKNVSPLVISGDIVLRLVEGLPMGQNYKMFMDNWFTSFSLMCALKEIGILALGTKNVKTSWL